MRKRGLVVYLALLGIFFLAGGAQSESQKEVLTFDQVKPYVTSLIYVDSSTRMLEVYTPQYKHIYQRLARRGFANMALLNIVWQAHYNLYRVPDTTQENSEEVVQPRDWLETLHKALRRAADELRPAYDKIEDKQDYFDLLSIRISQILSRDAVFLKPFLKEVESLLEAEDAPIRCSDCKEKFAEWLRNVGEDSPEEGQ